MTNKKPLSIWANLFRPGRFLKLKIMEFISTKGMTNDSAPSGEVLVQYLEPSWGSWYVNFATAYFDNPNDYDGKSGKGWVHAYSGNTINVLAYCFLPEPIKTRYTDMSQTKFSQEFGSQHPNLGSIGE